MELPQMVKQSMCERFCSVIGGDCQVKRVITLYLTWVVKVAFSFFSSQTSHGGENEDKELSQNIRWTASLAISSLPASSLCHLQVNLPGTRTLQLKFLRNIGLIS